MFTLDLMNLPFDQFHVQLFRFSRTFVRNTVPPVFLFNFFHFCVFTYVCFSKRVIWISLWFFLDALSKTTVIMNNYHHQVCIMVKLSPAETKRSSWSPWRTWTTRSRSSWFRRRPRRSSPTPRTPPSRRWWAQSSLCRWGPGDVVGNDSGLKSPELQRKGNDCHKAWI